MNQESKNKEDIPGKQSDESPAKNILFIVIVAAMFLTGIYSLFLASNLSSKAQTFTTDNLLRTAAPIDSDKIKTALGPFLDMDFIFVVLYTSEPGTNPNLVSSVRSAARAIADSGITSSVRILYPDNDDFASIVEQNDIKDFPAVLAVKKEGGIVQIINDYSEKYLQFAYHRVWGKTSDCSNDKSAVY